MSTRCVAGLPGISCSLRSPKGSLRESSAILARSIGGFAVSMDIFLAIYDAAIN